MQDIRLDYDDDTDSLFITTPTTGRERLSPERARVLARTLEEERTEELAGTEHPDSELASVIADLELYADRMEGK